MATKIRTGLYEVKHIMADGRTEATFTIELLPEEAGWDAGWWAVTAVDQNMRTVAGVGDFDLVRTKREALESIESFVKAARYDRTWGWVL